MLVTVRDVRPPARFDEKAWTQARLQEAATEDGEFATIETFELDVDADPSTPARRSFTSEEATLDAGWYRIVWADEDEDLLASEPVEIPANPNVTPTLAEVAALERSRTTVMGSVRGTFDEDTNPTATQVQELITMAVDDISARVGTIPYRFAGEARRLAALQAASLIESSYFPQELDTERSAHRTYSAMYLAGVEALKHAIPRAVRLV